MDTGEVNEKVNKLHLNVVINVQKKTRSEVNQGRQQLMSPFKNLASKSKLHTRVTTSF